MNVRDIRNAIDGLPDDTPVVLGVQMDDYDCQPHIGLLSVGQAVGRLVVHLEYESGCECDDFDDMDDEDDVWEDDDDDDIGWDDDDDSDEDF